jgi:3-(3-hydroxy-phenyl)propionate hydroxylase
VRSISTISQGRDSAIKFVQGQAIANKRRLEERDPEVRPKNLDNLTATAADAARAKQFLARSSMLGTLRRGAAMTLDEAVR